MKPVRESEYFVAWLAFYVAATVAGGIVGGIVGGIAGFIMGAAGLDITLIRSVGLVIGFVIGVPISYGCFRIFVDRLIVRKMLGRTSQPSQPSMVFPPAPPLAGGPVGGDLER